MLTLTKPLCFHLTTEYSKMYFVLFFLYLVGWDILKYNKIFQTFRFLGGVTGLHETRHSITMRILLLKYCNASPSSSDTHGAPLPLCRHWQTNAFSWRNRKRGWKGRVQSQEAQRSLQYVGSGGLLNILSCKENILFTVFFN